MEIKDLKRDYYVQYNNSAKKVYYFNDDTVYFYDLTSARAEDCKPLKIDDKILKGNNFYKTENEEGYTIYSIGGVTIKKKEDEGFYRILIRNEVFVYGGLLNFMHELQEAFDACALVLDWHV